MARLPIRSLVLVPLVLLALPARPAAAALGFYVDRLAFDAEAPGLPIEDFEEGVPDTNFTGPLDSTTSNDVFSPGDILPGLSIDTDIPGATFGLRVRDLGNTKILSTPSTLRQLELSFEPAAGAVGMDVYQLNADGDVLLEIHGASGLLGSAQVPTGAGGAFFGVVAVGTPITRIVVDDTDIVPGIDDVAFAPEPGSGLAAAAAVVTLAVGARRRARAARK